MTTENKTRVLLITGREASADLQALDWKQLQNRFQITIHTVEMPVIAFISKQRLEEELKSFNSENFDFVLVSGLIPWDLNVIESGFKNKVKKGSAFLARLPEILAKMDLKNLSTADPADKLFQFSTETRYNFLIEQSRQRITESKFALGFPLSTQHPEIIFSPSLPAVIIGEIIDFPHLTISELEQKIAYYIQSGADIIDLGCIVNEDNSEKIEKVLPQLKKKYSHPFAIDSLNPKEIHTAVKCGAEMVLSINVDNCQALLDLPKDITLVLIPFYSDHNMKNMEMSEKIQTLMQLGKFLSEQGFNKLFLDPILNSPMSPGFVPTIEILNLLRNGLDRIAAVDEEMKPIIKPQLFMGFSNVTELIDADSPGINTFLTLLAAELGVSAILTTEYSNKTRKSIEELNISRRLAFLAKEQHVPPISLGYSALRFKSKHGYQKYVSYKESMVEVPPAESPAEMDPKGFFKIYVDTTKQIIVVTHFNNNEQKMDATKSFTGTSAESIYKSIIKEGLISRLDHAAYLGKELTKAELALKVGSEYIES